MDAREKMKQDLLNRTKESYDRKEGEAGAKHFDPDLEIPYWRPATTKGKPHIIDIIPFVAGPNFPSKVSRPTKAGDYAYVLDLWVHKKVGPGKMVIVCPARNYGNRCPVCEEVDEQLRQGLEYEDIPFAQKRQCTYNVLVMDDTETEAKGIQVWDVSYAYSEKAIAPLAKSARDGGYVAFSDPDRSIGRSIAFDVGADKYKKITGHRFEQRDYDIPDDFLASAFQLDTMIKIFNYEELCHIMYGDGGKPEVDVSDAPVDEIKTAPRSLRGTTAAAPTEDGGTTAPGRTLKTKTSEQIPIEKCPIGGVYADDFDKYGECDACELRQKCAEAADMKQYQEAQSGKETAAAPNPTPKAKTDAPVEGGKTAAPRRLLRRTA